MNNTALIISVVVVVVVAMSAYYVYWYEHYCTCMGMASCVPKPAYAFWANAEPMCGCGQQRWHSPSVNAFGWSSRPGLPYTDVASSSAYDAGENEMRDMSRDVGNGMMYRPYQSSFCQYPYRDEAMCASPKVEDMPCQRRVFDLHELPCARPPPGACGVSDPCEMKYSSSCGVGGYRDGTVAADLAVGVV